MRKFYLLLLICMSASVLSARAQISLAGKPSHNAKLSLLLLTQHTILNDETFHNAAMVFNNYYKEIATLNEDKTLAPETVKSRVKDSASDLDAKLKVVLSSQQYNTWLNIIKPDIQKQLQNN